MIRARLSSRLILAVVLTEALMLGLLVWNSVRLISSSHAELLERSTQEQSLLLANSLAPGLAAHDRAILQDVLSLLRDQRYLHYAVVYDRHGQALASVGRPPAASTASADHSYGEAIADGVFDVARNITVAGQYLGEVRVGYATSGVEQLTRQTQWQNTIIAGAGLLLTVIVTVLLGLILTRHLRRLESGARALQEGRLDYRISIHSRDEVGDLAQAFNQLAEHLEQTQTALGREHAALEREKRHLDTLLNSIDAVIWEADPTTGRLTYVSREAEAMLGYPVSAWFDPDFRLTHVHPDDASWVLREYRNRSQQPGSFSLDYRMFHCSGRTVWVRDLCTCEADERGRLTLRGLSLDVTVEKAAEDRIVFLADHDPLTGLINRRRFQEELEHHIAYAQRYGHQGALLFLDLDQFKCINDSFGHQQGDEFLIQVAQRLNANLRQTDLLGRLGGDEFGILLPQASVEQATRVADALLAHLKDAELQVPGQQHARASASIGIAMLPDHGATAGDLLAKADAAMYAAKEKGRNQYHLYSEQDTGLARMHAKIHWEERIQHALDHDRFVLHYQPVIDLSSGEVSHHEVLLRMIDEDGSLISPGAFLEVAERFGMIREIDHWVLERAIRTQGECRRDGLQTRMAVNLSGRHFGSDEILGLVKRALAEHHADPASIIFEVTETAAVENLAEAQVFIESLRQIGCQFALDDFGIGFSSFYYLKHLPVDYVKIDGSFVRNMDSDGADAIFVRTIADLARSLGIVTVAECIERGEVVQLLRELKVDMGQGYYLGRPAPEITTASPLLRAVR